MVPQGIKRRKEDRGRKGIGEAKSFNRRMKREVARMGEGGCKNERVGKIKEDRMSPTWTQYQR